MRKSATRYEALAREIASQIHAGVLRPGERIPSVRTSSRIHGLSSNTVLHAYRLLEDWGEVRGSPRSGYYVTARSKEPAPLRSSESGNLRQRLSAQGYRNSHRSGAGSDVHSPASTSAPMKRYQQLAEEFMRQIRAGILRPGDRLPSVRKVGVGHSLSPATVLQAFRLLEDQGAILARPRSGHYVSARRPDAERSPPHRQPVPTSVEVDELYFDLLEHAKHGRFVPLSSPYPAQELLPLSKLASALSTAARRFHPQRIQDVIPAGNAELRRLIARRFLESGCNIPPEEIVITAGALEAINLSLQAVTGPGDVVAVASPTLHLMLMMIQRLRLKVIELPADHREGISLAALVETLKAHPIKACCLMTNFHDPLGSLMPDEKKRELVGLLAERGVPLIENDVYAELYFGTERPKPAKAFDRSKLVLHCGSFSKCLAPGYRVGWAAAGRYTRDVERRKLSTSIATNVPSQAAIVEFLKHGGYNHHLRRLRNALKAQRDHMLHTISRHFPPGTHVTRPTGGTSLWVEMPERVKALQVHQMAVQNRIAVAPGSIFSSRGHYENCMRLSFGLWSPQVEAAVATLGQIATSLA
jgi:DNA-binding transcriptional MocR family regulator